MLRDCRDGSVLKGAAKPLCGKREIQFYEDLRHNISNASMLMLRELVPEYRGSIQIHIRGKLIDFIKLADLTHDMSKPCIMDIKIGERTWDPLATSDKIKAEEQKYAKCKKKLGFCIPGFQVYDIKNGRIKRFGKEYGKKLSAEKVKDGNFQLYTIHSFKRLLNTSYFWNITNPSVKSFSECKQPAEFHAIAQVFINIAIYSEMGTNTNHSTSLLQLIIISIRCRTIQESIVYSTKL